MQSQIWVETEENAQSSFKKQNFGNSIQKLRKSKYQSFLVITSFAWFLYFVSISFYRMILFYSFYRIENVSSSGKIVRIWSYSALRFPAFGLNMERYSASLCIQSECRKMRTRITPMQALFTQYSIVNFHSCCINSNVKFHSRLSVFSFQMKLL